jgi:hypothetical protein
MRRSSGGKSASRETTTLTFQKYTVCQNSSERPAASS